MKIEFDRKFKRQLKKISKKDKQLYKIFLRKLDLLKEKPDHKSLRLHKVSGKRISSWSVTITYKVRVLFVLRKKSILLTDIGSHDEVY